jgi:hypothetical protein
MTMEARIEIRPPLRGVRVTLGLAFLAAGFSLLLAFLRQGVIDLLALLPGALFLPVGLGLSTLERVVGVEKDGRMAFAEWRWCGFLLRRRTVDVSAADQVAIIRRREAFIPGEGTIMVADTTFPVVIRAGGQTLFRAIGWAFPTAEQRFHTDISLPTPAFFPSFARHTAARLAVALHLPLLDETTGEHFTPEAIPQPWLDSNNVSAQLAWRRYGA